MLEIGLTFLIVTITLKVHIKYQICMINKLLNYIVIS